ncbi:MAG TPA: hypothetical protein VJO34_02860 [Methylomirabilota bacterium]|nr:hypothetical protein [Methylomirabilota bacterium]
MSEVHATSARPIEVGGLAPDFSLPRAQGGVVTLKHAIRDGPAVLWFSAGMV